MWGAAAVKPSRSVSARWTSGHRATEGQHGQQDEATGERCGKQTRAAIT
jgi:hypothetical protein